MTTLSIFARVVALVGGTMVVYPAHAGRRAEARLRRCARDPRRQAAGQPCRRSRCRRRRGWTGGQTPIAAPGLKVNAFATGLEHPRWIHVLPNGDVLVAEAMSIAGPDQVALRLRHAQHDAARRRAVGVSANRITLLRDADGDGVAEIQEVFLDGLNQPFGMALLGDTFYVGNTDGVVAFPYTAGATAHHRAGRKLSTFKPGGHWTRSLLPSPDGTKLYAGVGSLTQHRRQGHGGRGRPRGDPRTRPRQRHEPHLRVAACAIRSASPGSPAPACSGRWSTSATGWATRRRRTT